MQSNLLSGTDAVNAVNVGQCGRTFFGVACLAELMAAVYPQVRVVGERCT